MKKIIVFILMIAAAFTLFSCNMGMGVGNMTFTHIHIFDHLGNMTHATVEKWYDNETGIEVKTKEYGSVFCSEGTYILYTDVCPLCGK